MYNLFLQGGPLFMGILTLIFLALLIVFFRAIFIKGDEIQLNRSIQWLKAIGTLGLVVGVLGQLIGLFSAFSVIESSTGISMEILAGGLKVSMITTLYGLIIYIIQLLCSMVLRRME